MTEVIVMLTALTAWYGGQHSRLLFAICVVSTFSICCNISFAFLHPVNLTQVNIYEVATNIMFALECVLIFATGIADRVGIAGRTDDSGFHSASDGFAQTETTRK